MRYVVTQRSVTRLSTNSLRFSKLFANADQEAIREGCYARSCQDLADALMTFEGTPTLSPTLEVTEAIDKHNAWHFNPTRLTKRATGNARIQS